MIFYSEKVLIDFKNMFLFSYNILVVDNQIHLKERVLRSPRQTIPIPKNAIKEEEIGILQLPRTANTPPVQK